MRTRVQRIALRPIGLRALNAFAEIMRAGSATAAGRELGMSQPAVSRLVARLESDVGFALFHREKGRLVPTKDALALAEEVELALIGLERVNSLVRDIASFATGELRLVAPPSFSEGVLPDIVAAFLKRFPGVRFSLDSRSMETTQNMVATRVADAGFVRLPVDRVDLTAETVVSSGTVCVLRQDHPLASRRSIGPAMLAQVPLILLGSGRRSRLNLEQLFTAAGVQPLVAAETHTVGSACALAARGIGVTIVNELLARHYIHPPLVTRTFEPSVVHEYAFVTSAQSRPSRLTLEFREEVRRHFAGRTRKHGPAAATRPAGGTMTTAERSAARES